MSFFPRGLYEADASSFTPLFRLLDDFDSYSRQSGGSQGSRRSAATFWQPKFDVRETDREYELHGELPGISKEAVHIEFSEPQTMTIRGRAERSYSSGTPPNAGRIEDVTGKPALTAAGDESAQNSHQATVEDESGASGAAVEKAEGKKTDSSKYKYWLTERSVGEFSRTFNFPAPVDHDSVTAGFKDGILTVSVPKAKKPESRRITIN